MYKLAQQRESKPNRWLLVDFNPIATSGGLTLRIGGGDNCVSCIEQQSSKSWTSVPAAPNTSIPVPLLIPAQK